MRETVQTGSWGVKSQRIVPDHDESCSSKRPSLRDPSWLTGAGTPKGRVLRQANQWRTKQEIGLQEKTQKIAPMQQSGMEIFFMGKILAINSIYICYTAQIYINISLKASFSNLSLKRYIHFKLSNSFYNFDTFFHLKSIK